MNKCLVCQTEVKDEDGRCWHTTCSAYSHKVIFETTCQECGGSGELMKMVCTGGTPYEVTTTCNDCDGEGVINED